MQAKFFDHESEFKDFDYQSKHGDEIEIYVINKDVYVTVDNNDPGYGRERVTIMIPEEHWGEFVERINNIKIK